MSRNPPRDPTSYAVGYGKPPASGRFPPGTSGNPRGRPKGTPTIGKILQDALNRRVAIAEGGKMRRLRVQNVILLRVVNDAMRGETPALKLLLALIARYGEATHTTIDMNSLSAEDRSILEEYLRTRDEAEGSASFSAEQDVQEDETPPQPPESENDE